MHNFDGCDVNAGVGVCTPEGVEVESKGKAWWTELRGLQATTPRDTVGLEKSTGFRSRVTQVLG